MHSKKVNKDMETLKTGTTTVGIVCKEGILMGADRRATAGNFIANKNVSKVLPINDQMVITTAGSVSDIQLIVKLLRAEIQLKAIRTGRQSTIKEAANLLTSIVYNNIRAFSIIPGITHFLFAGFDSTGVHLYEIYPDGSMMEVDDFVSSGSGSVMVYGVLESSYKKGISLKDGQELVSKGIMAAVQRDSASGNGFDIYCITPGSVKKVFEKTFNLN